MLFRSDREFSLFKVKSSGAKRTALKKAIKNKAHVIDESQLTLILGKTGTTDDLDQFEEELKKIGIIEMVRSGKLVMAKGKEPT